MKPKTRKPKWITSERFERIGEFTVPAAREKVFPLLFDEAVLGVRGALGYQLTIDRPAYKDRLHFRVEFSGDPFRGKEELLNAIMALPEIRSGLDNDLLERPEVEVILPDQKGWVPKTRTIIDNRKQFD